MSAVPALWERPLARFRVIAHPLLLGPGEWGTERYRFGGPEVWARVPPQGQSGVLYLQWVGAIWPGQGDGAAGICLLTAAADQAGLMLTLHADSSGTWAMQRHALRAWYERFGFVATRDRLVPYGPGRLGVAMHPGRRTAGRGD